MRNSILILVLFTYVLFALLVQCSVARFQYPLYGYQRKGLYNAIVPINGVNYRLMLDLATSVTWIQCDGPHAIQAPNPPYRPHNNFVSRRDPNCPTYVPLAPVTERCAFTIRYPDGSSCSGSAVKDNVLLSGNGSNVPLVFGCATYGGPYVGTRLEFDGTLGLGRHTVSFISQIHAYDIRHSQNMFGHCLGRSTEGAYSGYVFFGHDNTPQTRHRLIMLPMQESGDLGLYVIGPADISVEGGHHRTRVQSIILDTATTYIHFNNQTYQNIEDMIELSLLLNHAPVRRVREGGIFPVCWRILRRINLGEIFKPIKLDFGSNPRKIISLQWEEYLQQSHTGNMCLTILRRGDAQTANILGASALRNKVVMYDNRARLIAWGTRPANCLQAHSTKHVSVSTNASME